MTSRLSDRQSDRCGRVRGARMLLAGSAAILLLATTACAGAATEDDDMRSDRGPGTGVTASRLGSFGTLPDGSRVDRYVLVGGGVEVEVIEYGGIITALRVPDRAGETADVVLGHDDLEGYVEESPYFGALIGRYGNRIAGGRFEIDGVEYELERNDGPNHLHGGRRGFDKVLWSVEPFELTDAAGLRLRHVSPDGAGGYPGTLEVEVTYTLTEAGALVVDYEATADAPTPVNLTQHSYFNLQGHASGDVLDHLLTLEADRYTPVGPTLIPTGEIAPVQGTPFDFRTPVPIGARIGAEHEQLEHGGGYDHNFVLARDAASVTGDGLEVTAVAGTAPWAGTLFHAARVVEPDSGRILDVWTMEPGVQLYSGNFLDGTITGKDGAVYGHRGGFCLETQHFPDSPNQPGFPSTILRPGETYRSRTVWAFSTVPGPGQ